MPPAGDEHAKHKTQAPNNERKGKLEKINKTLLETQHRLTTPLHTSRYILHLNNNKTIIIIITGQPLRKACLFFLVPRFFLKKNPNPKGTHYTFK